MQSTAILFTAGLIMASGAAAQDTQLHVGDTVYATNLPYCVTLADAEKIAAVARKNGSPLDAFMNDDNCMSGHGKVVLMRQLDAFPDNTTRGGYRYIVEVRTANETVFGLLEEPLQPAQPATFGIEI